MNARSARAAVTAALLFLGVAAGNAQTNDALFRSWSFTQEPASPRSAALAGADRACADDVTAAGANPAALSSLDKNEILVAARTQGGDTDEGIDHRATRAAVSFAGGLRRLGPRAAAGAYVAQPHSDRVLLARPVMPDGRRDAGALETIETELGAAAAWHVYGPLHIGARFAARYLSLDGDYAREPAQGAAHLRAGTSVHAAAPSLAAGVLLTPMAALRLGVYADSGASWRVRRTATSPELGVVLDEASEYEVRVPSRLLAGIAVAPHPRLEARVQVDHVRWSEVRDRLTIAQGAYARSEYALEDAWEPAAAIELSLPFPRFAVQLRAGLRDRAPGRLRYLGADEVARASFTGDARRRTFGVGAGLFLRRGLHADLALTGGGVTTVAAGVGWRF